MHLPKARFIDNSICGLLSVDKQLFQRLCKTYQPISDIRVTFLRAFYYFVVVITLFQNLCKYTIKSLGTVVTLCSWK